MIKLCIFDLDGTILDTVETIAHYGNYALLKNGIEPIEPCEYKYLAGTGIKNLIKNMLDYRNSYSEELFKKVFLDYDTAYNKDVSFKSGIFAGLKEVLDKLKKRGIRLAIASNKPDYAAKSVVSSLYGDGYFVHVSGHRENAPLKPDPSMVFEILNEQGVSNDECLYIGDTSVDMKTGKNAGIFTVGVLWGFRDRDELSANGADLIIEKPDELYDYVCSVM